MSKKKNKGMKKSEVINKIFEGEPIAADHSKDSEFDSDAEVITTSINSSAKGKAISVFGAFLTIFAVIGFVSSIIFGYRFIKDFSTGASSKKELLNVIYPLVMIDATEFNDISELSSDQIISSSIWSILMSPEELEKYEATMDVINVPANDVEKYASHLFGDSIPKLEHTNVGAGEILFYYVASTNSYNVSSNPIIFNYVPDIKSVDIDEDIYTIEVDYVVETPAWRNLNEGFEKQVAKTVEFKLYKHDDSYIIQSLKVLNANSLN